MNVLSDKVVNAKKHYPCDACYAWDRSGYGKADVTAEEWLIVEAALADKYRILPGQPYRKLVYVDGGRIVTYRGRPGMDSICLKYEMFEE